ncbi:hypothetical protein FACS1894208_09790 [Clostridia bacterium]|nr:hypothetical protein FACS1894208_09790 [Clostridia bacterium]
MSEDIKRNFGNFGGFGTPQGGFSVTAGFPNVGFPSTAPTADPAVTKPKAPAKSDTPAKRAQSTKPSTAIKVVTPAEALLASAKKAKAYDGVQKLTKAETVSAWKEFGGDPLAVYESDGSARIIRVIARESKKSGGSFNLTETLTRELDGHGNISWRLVTGVIAKRKAPTQKFDENWETAILQKVREVVVGGAPVFSTAKALAAELGVSFSVVRANLWTAEKWARGEAPSFLPHRSMIRPIVALLCELGKRDEVIASLTAYCNSTTKPSVFVTAVLDDYR